jgi:predicted MPP superfamily phosphohydrolase
VFSLLFGLGGLLGHLYIYRRLVRKLAPGDRWRDALGAFLAGMTVLLVFRGPIGDIHPTVDHVHEMVTYSWIALALCMVSAVALGDLAHLALAIGRRFARPAAAPPPTPAEQPVAPDPGRRHFVTRVIPWSVAAGGVLTAGYGAARAFGPAEITELAVRLPRLPRALDGLTIVQLTDIHVGPFIGHRFLDRLVDQANALRPDLVVITGDLVDGDVATLGPAVSRLAALRSRYGSFFVTGNHEYYSGEEEWTRFVDSLGIETLRNRHVPIGDAGGRIDLVGVDDWSGSWRTDSAQRYDLDRALAGRDPERAAVLLAHQPMNFDVAADKGVGLQISGHTHGGQIFPITLLVNLRYEHHRGHYTMGESHLYVSRGCGFWGPPARVDSPPELVKLVLTT